MKLTKRIIQEMLIIIGILMIWSLALFSGLISY